MVTGNGCRLGNICLILKVSYYNSISMISLNSSRLVYKNSKPDFVICTHRQLMEEEGRDLLGKRTMDFKVSYLDTGLASTYFAESDQLVVAPSGSPNSLPPPTSTPNRPNRRYKTQLRDFLSTCRSKRKLQQSASSLGQVSFYFIIF